MCEDQLELYRQRYETWRHLDSQRYRTVQISASFVGAAAAVIVSANDVISWWILLALSILLILESRILTRINDAIHKNGDALREYGVAIGDKHLPDTSQRSNSIFYYLEWLLLSAGILFALVSAFLAFG